MQWLPGKLLNYALLAYVHERYITEMQQYLYSSMAFVLFISDTDILSGPESSLRWLRQAHIDITNPQWDEYCPVPLGISTFYARDSNTATPLMWGSTRWDISWVIPHPCMDQRRCILT